MATTTKTTSTTSTNGSSSSLKPFVRIIEQPAKCAIRFRYECEGRSAGSIPGVNATPENKTFPTIQVCNYHGKAVVVVSCVTKEPPYRPHPHNLVGKEGCKKGVCTLVIDNNAEMTCTFTSLGIQCVKRNKIEESLKLREMIKVDPFRTGFAHRTQASSIDLNCLRLCFQVFVEGPEKGKFTVQLPPVVSDAIYDKKAMAELIIVKLSHYSAPCTGGKEIILLCDRVAKDDIQVRFVQEGNNQQGIIWEAYGEFLANDVHKQVAISLRTPKYFDENISQPVTINIQLRRPSDGCLSLPRSFQITPRELDPDGLVRKRHKRLKEENYDLLQEYIQLASRQQQQPQQKSSPQHQPSSKLLTTIPTTSSNAVPPSTGIAIKREMSPGPAAMQSSSSYSATSSTAAEQQQFQFIHHHSSSPQYVMSDSSMSPSSRPPSQYQYQDHQSSNHVILPTAYNTSSSPSNSYEATPITNQHHQLLHHHHHHPQSTQQSSSSSMAYALAAAAAALVNNGGGTSGQSPSQFHHQQKSSPNHHSSSSPVTTHQHLQQQQQQEIPNEVMERFDSLDIDSSELIPDLDFNSNTMLSLMMDTSSGLSLNLSDSFNDITNNNNAMINGNNNSSAILAHSNNDELSTTSANRNNKLKLNLLQNVNECNNNTMMMIGQSLDTPIIEMIMNNDNTATTTTTTTNAIQIADSSSTVNNNNNNNQQQQQQMFSALDLDNNNHITHLN
ncbi:embryonic polarity protein dorsal-like protein [Dermatophagoides farinae]|uniref:Embryonic polarity protein dorsal-like protein n=1 Tax=Dermatophagoides farinae TaxID=6954 RepID=A0A9D4NX97_DERFA|nr:embryonic polarity protein dorsal-like protein [Dermatophagoides farinae]